MRRSTFVAYFVISRGLIRRGGRLLVGADGSSQCGVAPVPAGLFRRLGAGYIAWRGLVAKRIYPPQPSRRCLIISPLVARMRADARLCGGWAE